MEYFYIVQNLKKKIKHILSSNLKRGCNSYTMNVFEKLLYIRVHANVIQSRNIDVNTMVTTLVAPTLSAVKLNIIHCTFNSAEGNNIDLVYGLL